MIDLYYWTTPNGHKVTIFLEEAGLEYRIIPVNIGRGEQFQEHFLKISPNNRIPAIVDHNPKDNLQGDSRPESGRQGNSQGNGKRGEGEPLSLFESGAILLYLAEKCGLFMPADLYGRAEVLQWLMWQMGGLGPMLGQNHHFRKYAPEPIPYAIQRYESETRRLYNILNRRLEGREYICRDYSIADISCYPWIVPFKRQGMSLAQFPHLKRWFQTMQDRPAVKSAYEKAKSINVAPTVDEEAKKALFGQTDARHPDG